MKTKTMNMVSRENKIETTRPTETSGVSRWRLVKGKRRRYSSGPKVVGGGGHFTRRGFLHRRKEMSLFLGVGVGGGDPIIQ